MPNITTIPDDDPHHRLPYRNPLAGFWTAPPRPEVLEMMGAMDEREFGEEEEEEKVETEKNLWASTSPDEPPPLKLPPSADQSEKYPSPPTHIQLRRANLPDTTSPARRRPSATDTLAEILQTMHEQTRRDQAEITNLKAQKAEKDEEITKLQRQLENMRKDLTVMTVDRDTIRRQLTNTHHLLAVAQGRKRRDSLPPGMPGRPPPAPPPPPPAPPLNLGRPQSPMKMRRGGFMRASPRMSAATAGYRGRAHRRMSVAGFPRRGPRNRSKWTPAARAGSMGSPAQQPQKTYADVVKWMPHSDEILGRT